ncbi:MAG: FecR family protein [Verrucomicrobiota bacterium]
MKSSLRKFLAFCAVMALGAMLNPAQAAAPSGVKAKVVKVVGIANYSDAQNQSGPVKQGMEVTSGMTITTGPGSSVYLDLGENQAITVKPDSQLSLDKLSIDKTGADTVVETKLEVKKGSILGDVKKLSAASKFEVKTANGVAGIRGTAFHIFAVGIFRCSNGQILVLTSSGQAFTVNQGQSLNAAAPQPTLQQLTPAETAAMVADVRELLAVVVVITREPVGSPTGPSTEEVITAALSATLGITVVPDN